MKPFDRSYTRFLLVESNYSVTLKTGLGVVPGHSFSAMTQLVGSCDP